MTKKTNYFNCCALLFLFLLQTSCKSDIADNGDFFNSEHWRNQALKDIIPYWSTKAIDSSNQMFYSRLDQHWSPAEPFTQYPSMLSRHLFSYAAGYLISGDAILLQRADAIKNYLLTNAWDTVNGGWYDEMSRTGQPVAHTKTTFVQVYAVTGLSMYYFVTRDSSVLRYINTSNQLLEQKCWDDENGGYYNIMNKDWTVKDSGKSFSSLITPVSGYLFYLFQATGDTTYFRQAEKILDVLMDKMIDKKTGWVLESFDREWNYIQPQKNEHEINIGHNIESAWMLLKAYQVNGNSEYRQLAEKLSEKFHLYGYQPENGAWLSNVARDSSQWKDRSGYWWIQAYGNMYSLNAYAVDGDSRHLDIFKRGADYWDKYFLDRKNGDTYLSVHADGSLRDGTKANQFKASYHNIEHALLNAVYIDLWVKNKPCIFYFYIREPADISIRPMIIEEKDYAVTNVWVNNEKVKWTFEKGCVNIKKGNGQVVKIELHKK